MGQKGSYADYLAFGAPLPGRVGSSSAYRYGFNGKENDSETGTQDYGFRIYNPSLGKFLSVDPLTNDYPWWSPYHFAGNHPTSAVDIDGLEPNKQFDPTAAWNTDVNGNTLDENEYINQKALADPDYNGNPGTLVENQWWMRHAPPVSPPMVPEPMAPTTPVLTVTGSIEPIKMTSHVVVVNLGIKYKLPDKPKYKGGKDNDVQTFKSKGKSLYFRTYEQADRIDVYGIVGGEKTLIYSSKDDDAADENGRILSPSNKKGRVGGAYKEIAIDPRYTQVEVSINRDDDNKSIKSGGSEWAYRFGSPGSSGKGKLALRLRLPGPGKVKSDKPKEGE